MALHPCPYRTSFILKLLDFLEVRSHALSMVKKYLRLVLKKIGSALYERWDLRLENMALRHQIAERFSSARSEVFLNRKSMLDNSFRSLFIVGSSLGTPVEKRQ
jgi:hypothetical protein